MTSANHPSAAPSLRVGVHANNLHLRLARAAAAAQGDGRWRFVDYDDGRRTGELLASGAIDLGGTGSTPPLAAQAAGLDIVYLAASPPRPANGALVVAEGHGASTVAGLAGRRIALIEGSFHTYLLALLAEQAGLPLAAFERVDLAPVASAAALREGRVDAWVAMDPLLPAELARGGLAVVPGSQGAIPNRSLFWTVAGTAEAKREPITAFLGLLGSVQDFVAADTSGAAVLLAEAGGADAAQWLRVLRSRDWSLAPVDGAVLAEQQAEADCLARHGVLPKSLDLARAAPPFAPVLKEASR